MKIKWKPCEAATLPSNGIVSYGGRFVITPSEAPKYNCWLTDRIENPHAPPKGFMTEDDAQRFAEGMIDRGERL